MGMTDAFEAIVLNEITAGNGTTISPVNWYLALYTAAPGEDGSGGTEVSGNAYARQTLSAATWAAAVTGQPSTVANTSSISFPTATGSWGTITHWALVTASSGGTVYHVGTMDTSKAVTTDDTVTFNVGDLVLQLGDPGDSY